MKRTIGLVLVGVLLGCGPQEPGSDGRDPMSSDVFALDFKDLFSDMRKVDLSDLVQVGARLATREVNGLLDEVPYLDVQLAPTEIYVTADRAKDDLTLHDIESLTAGLLARFGDQDFISHVGKLRVRHLQQNPEQVFAEAQFKIDGKLSPSFSSRAGGLPAAVGFLAAAGIQATVVTPCRGELPALIQAPVKAVKAMRGFVLPEGIADVQAMAPGESLTLQSHGAVGLNVGVGLPIYLTTVADVATLHAVISAAARAALQGQLDIQLVRDQGNLAVVDVGVTGDVQRAMSLAVDTRWGVEGLPELRLQVGPLDVDVSRLAEKALTDLLNRKLSLAGASYATDQSKLRHTVARFSFDLGRRDQPVEEALFQALYWGDIRLAQGLANRPGSGVVQLLDLTRDSRSLSSLLGAHFLSMRFYRQIKEKAGSIVITTGPQSQQLLFDELDKENALFFTTRATRRRALVSLQSEQGRLVEADLNLGLQLRENDRYTARDQVLDHVDPLLALFIGKDRLAGRLAPHTDGLEHYLEKRCPSPHQGSGGGEGEQDQEMARYRECLQNAAQDPAVAQGKAAAMTVFQQLLAEGVQEGLHPAFDSGARMADALFRLKLAVQGSSQYPALWTGPRSRMTVDARLTEAALGSVLASADGVERFGRALQDTLALLSVDRAASPKDKLARLESKLRSLQGQMEKARAMVRARADDYRRLQRLVSASYQSRAMGPTTLGEQAHVAVLSEDGSANLASIAERKSATVVSLFDELVSKLSLGLPSKGQAVVYSLLAAATPAEMELLVNFDFSRDDYSDFPDTRLHGQGQAARLIEAGQFSVDALIGN